MEARSLGHALIGAVMLAAVFLADVGAVPTSAQVRFARTAAAPHADSSLSDPAWQKGLVPDQTFEDLTTRRPSGLATKVSVLYDDQNLYVGFWCEQAGVRITASQTTNDVGFGSDDFVGVGLDTSGNGSQVYFFETTPRAVRYQQASESVRYKPQWSSQAFIGADGWSAVMTIPLKAMRIHGGQQGWRINFIRGIAATGDHFTWAYEGLMQDNPAPFWPSPFDARYWPSVADLHIASASQSVRPHPHAEIYGLSTLGKDRGLFQQSDGSFAPQQIRYGGLDATLPLTNTINFVTTVFPDFSNIEVDQATIAPQEFVRNLQEYRPFFAQGANYIDANGAPVGTPIGQPALIFYSPGVGPFDYGSKVEGTFGKQSFGLLNFRGEDATTSDTFDDFAYGFKHAEGNRSFVYWLDGVSAHHEMVGSDDTNEIGIASRNLGSGFVALANTSIENGSSVFLNGQAHNDYGFVDEAKPNYEINVGYQDLSPNYAPLDGITPNSDIRGFNGYVAFSGNTPGLKNWSFNVTGDRLLDRSGAVHQADGIISGAVTFQDQISLYNLGTQIGELRSYDIPSGPGCSGPIVGQSYFTGYPCYIGGQTSRFELYGGAIGYRDGTSTPVDFSVAQGPYGPNDVKLYSATTSRPIGKHISIALEYDGTLERSLSTGLPDSQWLRRISIGDSISSESNFSIGLRSINGRGGFAEPGVNVAGSFHTVFPNGSEMYVSYGTPAATATLDRLVIKYIVHAGSGTGT